MRDSRRSDRRARPARGRCAAANAPTFISHASTDARFVAAIDRALQADKLKTWVDRSDIRFGALLRDQLLEAIRGSRAVVLVWSKAAFKSRWVMAEIFMAYYLDRFIIPCALDATPLPQFLANSVYLDRRHEKRRLLQELGRAVRSAPAGANKPAAVMVSETPDLQTWIDRVGRAQYDVVAAAGNPKQAALLNRKVGADLRRLQKTTPLHPRVLNLAGYQCKNTYMLKHDPAIQAGRAPKDPLLQQGERYFFESLCVDPNDMSAINGLGNILFYERELDAAEFFHRSAIDRAKRTGRTYPAAQHDLALVLKFKQQPAA